MSGTRATSRTLPATFTGGRDGSPPGGGGGGGGPPVPRPMPGRGGGGGGGILYIAVRIFEIGCHSEVNDGGLGC